MTTPQVGALPLLYILLMVSFEGMTAPVYNGKLLVTRATRLHAHSTMLLTLSNSKAQELVVYSSSCASSSLRF